MNSLTLSGIFFTKKSTPICLFSLSARLAPKNINQTNKSCAISTDHATGEPAHRMTAAVNTNITILSIKKLVTKSSVLT